MDVVVGLRHLVIIRFSELEEGFLQLRCSGWTMTVIFYHQNSPFYILNSSLEYLSSFFQQHFLLILFSDDSRLQGKEMLSKLPDNFLTPPTSNEWLGRSENGLIFFIFYFFYRDLNLRMMLPAFEFLVSDGRDPSPVLCSKWKGFFELLQSFWKDYSDVGEAPPHIWSPCTHSQPPCTRGGWCFLFSRVSGARPPLC